MTTRGFAHDALVYDDSPGLLAGTIDYLRAGLAEGALTFALVPPRTAALIGPALGDDAESVRMLDMAVVGRNPARVIPTIQALVDEAAGRPVRGLSQPYWPGRPAAEVAEAALHEALLDEAFAHVADLSLRCPYPASAMPSWSEQCHHTVVVGETVRRGEGYTPTLARTLFDAIDDDEPAVEADVVHFGLDDLPELRDLVTVRARAAGLDRDRALDLTLAANEIVTNSICHGGERGTLRLWTEDGAIVCEVSDSGHIMSAMVGRIAPLVSVRGGRGVWLANQLCDLVRIRSRAEGGTVVRLAMHVALVPATI